MSIWSAVFTVSSFDCPDCSMSREATVTNVKGTPTNSPMMEFSCQGLTVKQSGFYLLRPIETDSSNMHLPHIFVPSGNIETNCVSTVWLDKGDAITFKTKTQDMKYLKGFQIRVHKV